MLSPCFDLKSVISFVLSVLVLHLGRFIIVFVVVVAFNWVAHSLCHTHCESIRNRKFVSRHMIRLIKMNCARFKIVMFFYGGVSKRAD